MKRTILWMTILFALAAACATGGVSKTLYVGPKKADCVGVAPQKCLMVKETQDGEWTYFYDEIEGFAHEEGYEYTLKITEYRVSNPPADASSRKYKLEKVVSKTETAAIDLAETRWRLTAMGPVEQPEKVPAGVDVTIEFQKEGRAAGRAACNRYFAGYRIDGAMITFTAAGSTRMMCPPDIMRWEDRFLPAVAGTERFEVKEGRLHVYYKEKSVMILEPQ